MKGRDYMSIESNKVNQVIEVSLGWVDVIAIFSGAASLVMAALAIWLSITFYKMSDVSAKEMKESTDKINSTVDKLEKMFDTMYADTFSMVKDTVSHMREQVDRNFNGEQNEVRKEIDNLVTEQVKKAAPEKLNPDEMKELILNIIKESKEIETSIFIRKLEDEILMILDKGEETYGSLKEKVVGNREKSNTEFFQVLKKLYENKVIVADFKMEGGSTSIDYRSPIRLMEK